MNGQLNDEEIKREFKPALQVPDWIYKKKIQLPFPLTADLLDAYICLGYPTWFELCELEPEPLVSRIATDSMGLIGVKEESFFKLPWERDYWRQ